jgi:hypothetical protein
LNIDQPDLAPIDARASETALGGQYLQSGGDGEIAILSDESEIDELVVRKEIDSPKL